MVAVKKSQIVSFRKAYVEFEFENKVKSTTKYLEFEKISHKCLDLWVEKSDLLTAQDIVGACYRFSFDLNYYDVIIELFPKAVNLLNQIINHEERVMLVMFILNRPCSVVVILKYIVAQKLSGILLDNEVEAEKLVALLNGNKDT